MRRLTILSLVICAILFASGERARSAPRQAVPRCFDVPGIADCITGPVFDAFWAGNGGLPVFGYPLTGERPEQNRDLDQRFMTQWFERNRFEDHPENEQPYQVLLGRLGAELLQRQGRGVEGVPPGATPPGRCRAFDVGQERQFVCDPFLRYWETNGLEFDGRAGFSPAESLALFGLPLTSPRRETNPNGDSVTTQWFERARFEDHGTKGVLLGLLGHEMLATLPPVPPTTPIVDADTGFLLGGASGGQWIDVETAARAYRAGETYRLWTLDGPAGQATGGAISLEGQPCPSTVEIALTPEPADDYKIGFTGTWDPRPRAITRLSTATVV